MKKAKSTFMSKICLSIDDGSLDGFTNIFPLLKKYNLPATFNIVTGYLDNNTDNVEKPFTTLTWQMVREMYSSSIIEFANHSSDHTNDWDSIIAGRDLLISRLGLPFNEMIGFASPESKLTGTELLSNRERFIKLSTLYVRTGMRIRSHRMCRILARKIGRIIHLGWIYKIAYHDTLLDKDDKYFLYSVPIMRDTTLNQVISLIKHAEAEERSIILMFHRIKKHEESRYNDNWCWDYTKFESLLRYLYNERLKGHIKVLKTQDITEQH